MVDKSSEEQFSDELLVQFNFLCKMSCLIVLVTGHRRENFGSGFGEICQVYISIMENDSKPNFLLIK